ncbi:MAG: hypothetical protein OFPI_01080 [Osedax symbiont Rs2]|nr:MAG: hypothetical protein OFPI_01080 [Osedax symbiont Rs2]
MRDQQMNNNNHQVITEGLPVQEQISSSVINRSLRSTSVMVLLCTSFLAGCSSLSDNALYGESGIIHDRSKEYQESEKSQRLKIPAHLQAKQTQDAMDVPQRQLAQGAPIDNITRPEYFYADSGTETVNFKQQGSVKVLIVDAPINAIWPKAQQFMEFNNLGLSDIDPQQGTIESDWVTVKTDKSGVVDTWFKKLTFQNIKGDNKNKIRIQLKRDETNSQRTVLSMAHVRYPVDQQVERIDWSNESKNLSYKTEMLYELLRFMSKATSGSLNNGLLASNFKRQQRDGLVLFGRNANGKPALKISGSMNSAWTLVDRSLGANSIDVGTKDRKAGTFYLTFTSLSPVEEESGSFIDWLHGDRGPLTLSSLGFGDDDDKGKDSAGNDVSYSATGQINSSKEIGLSDPQHPANQEGFKVWLGGKVVYNFNEGFNKGFFNSITNLYELTAGYRLRLTHRGNATFITVLDKEGLEAPSVPAEELLWVIKDRIPRA